MKAIKTLFLCFCPLVITDPYKNIRYGEIETYDYTEPHKIKIIEPEKEKPTKRKTDRYFCFVCNPPQWIYFEN